MFRLLILLLTLSLLPLGGLAETPDSFFAEDLAGLYVWPEGASVEDASYVYRFTYPQLAGDDPIAQTINNIYQYEASYALDFDCPMNGSSHDPAEGQMQVNITYEVTHLSSDYLSLKINKEVALGKSCIRVVTAHTFPLTGERAGTVTSLPFLLGILDRQENDEWLIQRQTAKVDTCVREMVWAQIEKAMRQEGSAIYPDMTYEEFEQYFYPEEEFHLNEAGDLVFFITEGIIAPQEAGHFFFTITMEELLDEI